MSATLSPDTIAEKGEKIYKKHHEELESKYEGKIVIIDIENGAIVAIGDTLKDADAAAKKGNRLRYARKIGKNPAVFRIL